MKQAIGYCRVSTEEQATEGVSLDFSKERVQPPWPGWEGIEISPEGIHTSRGLLKPTEIDLLSWKASFYDRGRRGSMRDVMNEFEENQQ